MHTASPLSPATPARAVPMEPTAMRGFRARREEPPLWQDRAGQRGRQRHELQSQDNFSELRRICQGSTDLYDRLFGSWRLLRRLPGWERPVPAWDPGLSRLAL